MTSKYFLCKENEDQDSLASDIQSAEAVQLSVSFSFDGYPMRTSEGAAEAFSK